MMKLNGSQSRLRRWIKGLAVYLATIAICFFLTTTRAAAAENSPDITVYRDPSCHCCGGWMDHLTAQGWHPQNVPTSEMDALKQSYGIPVDLTSCHTAIIDGYVIEGHVPIAEIRRLIAEHPDVVGIAVPGMPIGTAGMESGEEREPFTVFSFDKKGNANVFSQYVF